MAEKNVKMYVGDKELLVGAILLEKTPLGGNMMNITFTDQTMEIMSEKRFEAMQTPEPSDATTARDQLIKVLSATMFSLMHEYDLRLSEIDPVINNLIELCNANTAKATALQWGVEFLDQRTLNAVNKVLMENHKKENAETTGDDGATS